MIPDKLVVHQQDEVLDMQLAGNEIIHWIVRVSIKNKEYRKAITDKTGDPREGGVWKIVVRGTNEWAQPYTPAWGDPPAVSIPTGKTGEIFLRFIVPRSFKAMDAELWYTGEEPYSSCRLSGEEMALVYDWSLKQVREEASVPPTQEPTGTKETVGRETYLVPATLGKPLRTMELRTIAMWEGSGSRRIRYNVKQGPVVLNFGSTKTSGIASSFKVFAWKDRLSDNPQWEGGRGSLILGETGDYEIEVEAIGVQWWVKAGVE